MKLKLIVLFTILLSVTVFAGKSNDLSLLNGIEEEVKLDYSVFDLEERKVKLEKMIKYEETILHQLQAENDKYEELVTQMLSSNSQSADYRQLEREASKQKRKTLRLLNKAEALADYIQWLRT